MRGEDLTVFGDGSQTRSFCYVADLVDGIYKLLLSEYSQPVNIGNPDEISLLDFAKEIIQLTGSKQKIIFKPLPADDPKQRQPDITRAKNLLKWSPSPNNYAFPMNPLSMFELGFLNNQSDLPVKRSA